MSRTYALRRGRQWICAPAGHDQAAVFCAGLTVCDDRDSAWLCSNLDLVHDRAAILRHVHGWSTEIRALHPLF